MEQTVPSFRSSESFSTGIHLASFFNPISVEVDHPNTHTDGVTTFLGPLVVTQTKQTIPHSLRAAVRNSRRIGEALRSVRLLNLTEDNNLHLAPSFGQEPENTITAEQCKTLDEGVE
ncbi:hypothetical protein OS493_040312 [Desmophyllum pertusum]|uniref:Uncharacterized protein n=1 Tax=Desmophyllum pertusum TaxID=174260 RepID=A0A9W9Z5E8_9CNID|nr:hypothetical protein OS493_040312 [Desmophyllum pertusum]